MAAHGLHTALPRRFTVFDLEFTAWEGSQARGWSGPDEYREVIQIGAVVVDAAHGFAELRSLRIHVRPSINARLSDYIVRLTGIEQRTIDECGVPFREAMRCLDEFAGPNRPLVCCGLDRDVLHENCAINGVQCVFGDEDVVNLRPQIAAALGVPEARIVSGELPQAIGEVGAARAHDALEDCRAIVRFLAAYPRANGGERA